MAFEVIRRNKASEMVAEQIIEQINSGELTAGSQLPSQRELSELLGVGRSSVREAINALAVIGYLEVQQGKGTFIRIPEQDPSIARLQSALEASSLLGLKEVQVLLECRSAELAAERVEENQILRLKAIIEKMKSCKDNHPAFQLADLEFHTTLAEFSENTVLSEMINLVIISVDSRYSAFETDRLSTAFIDDTIYSFEKLVESLEQKDGEQASKWIQYHVNLVLKEFKNILKS
jgi:GntR family transcriptional repressor for pyruvate dehydrogenase complex